MPIKTHRGHNIIVEISLHNIDIARVQVNGEHTLSQHQYVNRRTYLCVAVSFFGGREEEIVNSKPFILLHIINATSMIHLLVNHVVPKRPKTAQPLFDLVKWLGSIESQSYQSRGRLSGSHYDRSRNAPCLVDDTRVGDSSQSIEDRKQGDKNIIIYLGGYLRVIS